MVTRLARVSCCGDVSVSVGDVDVVDGDVGVTGDVDVDVAVDAMLASRGVAAALVAALSPGDVIPLSIASRVSVRVRVRVIICCVRMNVSTSCMSGSSPDMGFSRMGSSMCDMCGDETGACIQIVQHDMA